MRAKRAASSSSAIELRVVSREIEAYQVEPPYGFGFVEVVKLIEEEAPASAAAIARVSRRIAPSDDGIDGTETVATYNTLEAMKRRPTSTTRSQIRLRRSGGPPRMLAEEDENEEQEGGGGYEEDDEEIEAARIQLERLVQQGEGGGGGGGGGGFRFEGQRGKEAATPKVIDDVAAGLGEAQDIGRRGLGLFGLGLTLSIEGLLSPIGLACFVLFGLLYASGEFGTVGFVAEAPAASEGSYYVPMDAGEVLGAWSERF